MARSTPVIPLIAIAIATALTTACDAYDQPNRPLPMDFKATRFDGTVLTPVALRGKPWVINLWVPG